MKRWLTIEEEIEREPSAEVAGDAKSVDIRERAWVSVGTVVKLLRAHGGCLGTRRRRRTL